MNQQETKAILQEIKQSLDGVLLRDRGHLNALMRRVRQCIHDGKPTDKLVAKLTDVQEQSLNRIQKRTGVQLKLDYPDILPISGKRADIQKLIEENQVVIVCGTTGSGKTTQLPKIVLEAGTGKTGRIGVTQPRRLAATGMARRVAEEMGTDYGKGVGCQVRFDDQTCDETLIKFMTDGILLAETQRDRHLLQYDCLIIDEAHERSLNIDFLLGYIKNLLKVRPDLKVVISSATLDAESFSAFFDHAPVIEVEGRTYPVEDFFLPPGKDEELSNHILRAMQWVSDIDDQGDVLIFLPGEREIRDATKKLEGRKWKNTEVLPLFGRLSMGEQQRVFKVGGRRRIILATNVAETSITIPGIHYVIDSGQVRLSRYNPRTQVQGLQVEQVSQASARQRRGRCGRVTDGICIYLYDEETLENSAAYTDPEIRRTSLAGVILQMDLLNLPPIDQFPLIDPPSSTLVNEGYKALRDIGAINEERKLTQLGRDIARFPTDPHLARMLVQAKDEGVLPEILILVAFLSIQDVRERPTEKADLADQAHAQWKDNKSDFITILNLWNAIEAERGQGGSHGKLRKFCKKNFVNYRRIMEWTNLWKDLRHSVRDLKWDINHKDTKGTKAPKESTSSSLGLRGSEYDLIHRSLLAGLPANIGFKGEANKEFTAARNRKFFIFPGSGLFKKPPEWVMTFSLVETTKLYARTVAEIQPEWVKAVAPHLCKSVYKNPAWDAEQGFVYAKESVVSGGLTLSSGRSVHFGPINPEEARKIFIREGMVPANLSTRGGWLRLHQQMLDDIQALEEKVRRPGALLDVDAIFEHFDRLLPEDVYSVKTLEQWIRKSKARIAMRLKEAMYPQSEPIRPEDYPEYLTFHEEDFNLIYTFDPGEKLDGIALVCPTDKLAFLPDWAPDWLVPGWLNEKVNRLLRTLPKNLRTTISPIDQTSLAFCRTPAILAAPDSPLEANGTSKGPLLDTLSRWLQSEYQLPIDASDFDESVLPEFLQMKVIETQNDEIVRVHKSISADHRMHAHRSSTELAFAKWTLPPGKTWPGGELPEFITSDDSKKTRGYPALTAEAGGVGRSVFMSEVGAVQSRRAGLAALFRIQQKDQVKYVEKRPPLTPMLQLTLSSIDNDFLTDLMNASIVEALTQDSRIRIQDAAAFADRAAHARTILYETVEENARLLESMIETREAIVTAIAELNADFDILHDLEMQLEFLFRPAFLQTLDVFGRYPRYLKAMQMRIQRIKNNPQADGRKLLEVEPFQNRLSEKLLESENITEAHDLIEFAMLLEEFRVNRFAPEIKTPVKVSAQRLEEAFRKLSA